MFPCLLCKTMFQQTRGHEKYLKFLEMKTRTEEQNLLMQERRKRSKCKTTFLVISSKRSALLTNKGRRKLYIYKINCRYRRIFGIFFIGALIRSIKVQYKHQTMNAAFDKTEKVFHLKLQY